MTNRRGWDALSATYRRRLLKNGIGPEEYRSGASLKAARGHRATPESISEYQRNPGRYREYRERRSDITQRVIEKKREAFNATIRWNARNSEVFVRKGKEFVVNGQKDFIRPPTIEQLRQIDGMTVDELIDFQYEMKDNDDWRFLWYH